LIQRNPSRPGASPAFPKSKTRTRSFLGKESSVTLKRDSSDFDIRRSALRKGAKQLKTRQEVLQSPPARPAPCTKQKAGRQKAPKALSPHNFRSTLSNNTTGNTGP